MKWERVKLGTIADMCLGKMLDQNKNKGEYQPYLANINVRWGSFNLDDLSQMRFEDREQERYGLEFGDLIICEGGEPGRCALWKNAVPNMKIQKALHRVRPHECLDNRYLYYWFLLAGKAGALEQYFTGATIKHMPGQMLASVLIDLPPISIQRSIAEILSTYDDLIENNQKQIKLLEEAAMRLYKEWFVNLRFPGHENTTILDGLPQGWKKTRISDIVDIKSGFAFKSKDFVANGIYGIVTIKNVQVGSFSTANMSHIHQLPAKMPKHCILKEGDILLSLTGNVGRVCIVYGENYLLNQRVAKLESQYMGYAYCLFSSHELFVEMNNLANGAAQQNLSPIKTGDIKWIIPSSSILSLFENQTSAMFKRISLLNKQIMLLVQARDKLLPKLMSGEIEV